MVFFLKYKSYSFTSSVALHCPLPNKALQAWQVWPLWISPAWYLTLSPKPRLDCQPYCIVLSYLPLLSALSSSWSTFPLPSPLLLQSMADTESTLGAQPTFPGTFPGFSLSRWMPPSSQGIITTCLVICGLENAGPLCLKVQIRACWVRDFQLNNQICWDSLGSSSFLTKIMHSGSFFWKVRESKPTRGREDLRSHQAKISESTEEFRPREQQIPFGIGISMTIALMLYDL